MERSSDLSMPQQGDGILVRFLEYQPDGTRFLRKRDVWPLHLTLAPWFTVEDMPLLTDRLQTLARHEQAQLLTFGGIEQFNEDTQVTVIAEQSGLRRLHRGLQAAIREAGEVVRSTEWTDERYNGHVTHHHGESAPQPGDSLELTNFSLVRLRAENICEVITTIALRGVA